MAGRTWVNYHHLLYFKTIAVEGSIAKAAKKLRLGQPTLSTQIKQFEDALGQKLFDRSKRALQLTEQGRLLLGYAIEIFRLGDEMIDAVNDRHQNPKLQVQLGAVDTVPKHLSLKLFEHARAHFDCKVSVAEGHTHELYRELRSHRLDLVIANEPPNASDSPGLLARSIARMPVAVYSAKKQDTNKAGFPGNLTDRPFIMPSPNSKLRLDLEHYFKINDIRVNIVAEIQDTALQKLICSHQHGLIALPIPAAAELVAQKDLFLVGNLREVYEELWLVKAQRQLQNPVAARIFKEFSL